MPGDFLSKWSALFGAWIRPARGGSDLPFPDPALSQSKGLFRGRKWPCLQASTAAGPSTGAGQAPSCRGLECLSAAAFVLPQPRFWLYKNPRRGVHGVDEANAALVPKPLRVARAADFALRPGVGVESWRGGGRLA